MVSTLCNSKGIGFLEDHEDQAENDRSIKPATLDTLYYDVSVHYKNTCVQLTRCTRICVRGHIAGSSFITNATSLAGFPIIVYIYQYTRLVRPLIIDREISYTQLDKISKFCQITYVAVDDKRDP